MLPERNRVTRPRLAFSCLECSRQKRRCDKSRPQCTTCLRLGKICVYNTGTRDPYTGRVSRMGPQEETTISSTSQDLTECVDDDHIPASGSHHNTDGDNPAVDVFRGSRTRVGARERHVGQGFWAFVEDKNLTDQLSIPRYLFYNEPEGEPFMPPSYISSFALAKLLTRLPTKPVCDALLQAFLVRVYPIYPCISYSGSYCPVVTPSSLLVPNCSKIPPMSVLFGPLCSPVHRPFPLQNGIQPRSMI
jgi:hypothetical protein